MSNPIASARRLVVKVGSSILIDPETGLADEAWLNAFASDVARVKARGQQIVVVSSGSIALGRVRLGLRRRRNLSLPEKQAAAAAGQSLLMRAWEEAFEPYGLACAQILLTAADTET
ncbi:MAG TPA: glutamate 5-kinase, partial [Caulobacteraceae bacterium]|nr:glutamate 5-kinase [Caulobacteraceae bacterium]